MKYLISFFGFFISCSLSFSQIPFKNPSFEGSCAVCGGAAPNWTVCAATPDVLPGCFGVNGPAQDKNTYAGFTSGETVGQTLGSPLVKGTSYSFTVYLKYDPNYANGSVGLGSCSSTGTGGTRGLPGKLEIWGGNASCTTTELLYSSPTMASSSWTQYVINFTPVSNTYNYIMLVQSNPLANICVDNLSAIVTVPVQLLSFKAAKRDQLNEISWSTASEKNNEKFVIERSSDGINYQEYGSVRGAGNSASTQNYKYIDHEPATGLQYYRLKQIDFDGKTQLMGVVPLDRGKLKQLNFLSFDQNSRNLILNLKDLPNFTTAQLSIYDINGKMVFSKELQQTANEGENFIDVTAWNNGLYFASITDHEEVILKQKFVK